MEGEKGEVKYAEKRDGVEHSEEEEEEEDTKLKMGRGKIVRWKVSHRFVPRHHS